MKTASSLLLLFVLLFTITSCGVDSYEDFDFHEFTSFRDVPGVTEHLISLVEELQSNRDYFVFGQRLSSEAFIGHDSQPGGFAVLLTEFLSTFFEIDFKLKIVDTTVVHEGITDLSIDFTLDFIPRTHEYHHVERTYPIAERSTAIFKYVNSGLHFYSEAQIHGRTIGSLPCMSTVSSVHRYFPDLSFTIVEVDCFDCVTELLMLEEIDLFITDSIFSKLFDADEHIVDAELFTLLYTPISISTDNTDLWPIIEIINLYLFAGGAEHFHSLYRHGELDFLRNRLTGFLTAYELEHLTYLRTPGITVPIALERDDFPISFYNRAAGEFQGIAVDLLAEISYLTGINFTVTNDSSTPWYTILDMLKLGEVALVSNLKYTSERKGRFLWAEVPFASHHHVLISSYDFPTVPRHSVPDYLVGTMRSSAYFEYYMHLYPNSENLILFDGMLEALDALYRGDIDMVMGTEATLFQQHFYRERARFRANTVFASTSDSAFGFNLNENALRTIISHSQYLVDTNRIVDAWNELALDYLLKLVYERQRNTLILLVAAFLSVALIIFVVLIYTSRKLAHVLSGKVQQYTGEVQEKAAVLKAVISSFPGIIWSVDQAGKLSLFDGKELEELGTSHLPFEGMSIEDADADEHFSEIFSNYKKTLLDGPQRSILTISDKTFRSQTNRITNSSGEILGVLGSVYDMTDLVVLQNELEEALEQAAIAVSEFELAQLTVSGMFNLNPHMNLLFNSDFKIIDCNPAAVKTLGFHSKEDLLLGFEDYYQSNFIIRQSDDIDAIHLIDRLKEADKFGHVKYEVVMHAKTQSFDLDIEIKSIQFGKEKAYVAYLYDITELKYRENELIAARKVIEEQKAQAEAANVAKSVFLSTMSHEIRTPMNAILGITEMKLLRNDLDVDTKEAFQKILSSGDLLLSIINDILELSKIESGKLELVLSPYDVCCAISDTAQLNAMHIGSKQIAFELQVDKNLPTHLLGDLLRIKQVLNNILSNAFKYTDEGKVTFSITKRVHAERNKIYLVLTVRDTGRGMSQEQINVLFDEYTRFNVDASKNIVGTGLGMPITRNLVHLMNGEIYIDSIENVGTTFTIELPQVIFSTNIIGEEAAENLESFHFSGKPQARRHHIVREPMPYGRVLIVDDVDTNIYVARGLMQPYGMFVESVKSGAEAIKKVESGDIYDIIFMDHMMPSMDGVEAVQKIRSLGYTNTIIALTANAVAGQARFFLENGFDDYLSKPIDTRLLNAILNKHVRDNHPTEVVNAARSTLYEAGIAAALSADALATDFIRSIEDRKFINFFIADVRRAIATLENVLSSANNSSAEIKMQNLVISSHGIKGALANVGQHKLSEAAARLEDFARGRRTLEISREAPVFLSALKSLISDLESRIKSPEHGFIENDLSLLATHLKMVKKACEDYDAETADTIVTTLREQLWSSDVTDLLTSLSEMILHSEFELIVDKLTQSDFINKDEGEE